MSYGTDKQLLFINDPLVRIVFNLQVLINRLLADC